jgi:hypothetical protein
MKIFISQANHRAAQIALYGPQGWKIALPVSADQARHFDGAFYEGELEFTPEQAKVLREQVEVEIARFAKDPYCGCENWGDRAYVDQCRHEESVLVEKLQAMGL